jgi:hypothetical protein
VEGQAGPRIEPHRSPSLSSLLLIIAYRGSESTVSRSGGKKSQSAKRPTP